MSNPENPNLNVVIRPEAQQLLDNFAGLMKVRTIFMAADGQMLEHGRSHGGNSEFCRLAQERFFPVERCLESDLSGREQCLKSRTLECYQCHAGLTEMVAPVLSGDQVLGFIMFGQFRRSAQMPEWCRGDTRMARAWKKLPLLDAEKLEELTGMLRMLVDYVVARELLEWHGMHRAELFERYLDIHLAEDIRLEQVSRYLGCSVSGLTKWLRESGLGNFKKRLTEKRLKHVEKLLRERPEFTVGEAAREAGYEDPHYFSRVYRQYRGRKASWLKK